MKIKNLQVTKDKSGSRSRQTRREPKKSALYIVPQIEDSLLLLYVDQENYPKFKAADEDTVYTTKIIDGSFIIEFEDGKPVFNGIAP